MLSRRRLRTAPEVCRREAGRGRPSGKRGLRPPLRKGAGGAGAGGLGGAGAQAVRGGGRGPLGGDGRSEGA